MDTLKAYALSLVGTPYKWGGNNPVEGLDCSGFIQELLRSVGLDPPGDQTAQALLYHFDRHGLHTSTPRIGTLAFFGESVTKVTHVAMCLDAYRVIEAGGGDKLTLTREDAAARGAFVRIRLLKARRDLVALLRPDYATIGVVA